jgi:hypothetical protein
MTPRIFVTLVAGVCAGAMLLPAEAAAAPRGTAAGPALQAPAPHAMRAPVVHGRPSPWVRPGHGPHAGRFARNHFRHIPGFAWPLAAGWLTPFVSEYDGGTGVYPDRQYPAYMPPPPEAASPLPAPEPIVQQVTRIIVIRGTGCETTAETVPWRDGSPRTIAMVRC